VKRAICLVASGRIFNGEINDKNNFADHKWLREECEKAIGCR